MTAEQYRTAAGTLVEISGKHGGIIEITWDWLEEGACYEAAPSAEVRGPDDAWLYWLCPCHGEGQARLEAVPVGAEALTDAG